MQCGHHTFQPDNKEDRHTCRLYYIFLYDYYDITVIDNGLQTTHPDIKN